MLPFLSLTCSCWKQRATDGTEWDEKAPSNIYVGHVEFCHYTMSSHVLEHSGGGQVCWAVELWRESPSKRILQLRFIWLVWRLEENWVGLDLIPAHLVEWSQLAFPSDSRIHRKVNHSLSTFFMHYGQASEPTLGRLIWSDLWEVCQGDVEKSTVDNIRSNKSRVQARLTECNGLEIIGIGIGVVWCQLTARAETLRHWILVLWIHLSTKRKINALTRLAYLHDLTHPLGISVREM